MDHHQGGYTYKAASETLVYSASRHKDWFDEQDVEAQVILYDMNIAHLTWINDKNSGATKYPYVRIKHRLI